MEFGIDIGIFYPYYSIEQALHLTEEAGFEYIEYPCEYFKDYDEHGLEKHMKEVAKIAEAYSIKPYQLHATYGEINFQLASSEKKVREEATRKIEEWIRYASMLNAPILVIHPAFIRPLQDATYMEATKRIAEINVKLAKRLARTGEEYDVKIAFENCPEPWFGGSPADLLWLISRANSDYIGACLDTGHANINQLDSAQSIRQLSNHLIATHIHDNNARDDQHYLPLMGTIDWKEVMRAFKDISYKYSLIFEVRENMRKGINLIK